MTSEVLGNGYTQLRFREGEAPLLYSYFTDENDVVVESADIEEIRVSARNKLSGEMVLDNFELDKADVWDDTEDTTRNFQWQTDRDTWITSGQNDCLFFVEVWVTPVDGQPITAWYDLVFKKSILLAPGDEEEEE